MYFQDCPPWYLNAPRVDKSPGLSIMSERPEAASSPAAKKKDARPVPTNSNSQTDTMSRNYALGIVNGTLSRLGMGFIHPYLVLSAFVYEQTKSNVLVGLVVTLSTAGLMWPQLYISSRIEHLPRKRPFYIFSTVLRIVTLGIVVATMFLAGSVDSSWILAPFFVAYFVYRTGQGCGNPVFLDLVGQSVAPTRLGSFFAYRGLLGGGLSFVAGFVVLQPILDAIPSPTNYAVLGAIAFVIMSCGWTAFAFVHEPKDRAPPKRRSFRQTAADGGALVWRDTNYRLLLSIRILLRFDLLALAFYVPYGVERLGAEKMSGVFVGCMAVSRLASSLIWGKISDRKGNRLCLICSAVLLTLSPATALVASRLPALFQWALPFASAPLDLPITVYILALCMVGFGLEAAVIGLNAFMLESAPPERRPSYIAFVNTVSFPFTFLPALAGLLVGSNVRRLDVLLAIVCVSGVLTLWAVWRLTEVRETCP